MHCVCQYLKISQGTWYDYSWLINCTFIRRLTAWYRLALGGTLIISLRKLVQLLSGINYLLFNLYCRWCWTIISLGDFSSSSEFDTIYPAWNVIIFRDFCWWFRYCFWLFRCIPLWGLLAVNNIWWNLVHNTDYQNTQ